MGCFFTCFDATKSKLFKRSRRNLVAATVTPSKEQLLQQLQQEEAKQEFEVSELLNIEKPINPIVESIEKPLNCTTKAKEPLDLNVNAYEKVSSIEEITFTDKLLVENNESDDQVKESVSTTLPSNSVDMEESNSDNRDNFLVLEDTSESLFSLSIDSRKQRCEAEYGEKEVTSPLPKSVSIHVQEKGCNENDSDPSQNLHDTVSDFTVENPTQREALTPLKDQDKENVCNSSQEPSFKVITRRSRLNSHNEKLVDQEISVDTSLSSWLVKSEASPSSVGNSARLILGELNVGQDNRNSDKGPLTGTVGSYWSRTRQVVDSD